MRQKFVVTVKKHIFCIFCKYYSAILTFFFQENAEETHITQFNLN